MPENMAAVRASISTPVGPEAVAEAVTMTSLLDERSGDGGHGSKFTSTYIHEACLVDEQVMFAFI